MLVGRAAEAKRDRGPIEVGAVAQAVPQIERLAAGADAERAPEAVAVGVVDLHQPAGWVARSLLGGRRAPEEQQCGRGADATPDGAHVPPRPGVSFRLRIAAG